jgi:hypothetical protein
VRPGERWVSGALLIAILGFTLLFWLMVPRAVNAECQTYPPNPPHEPTGIKGCEIYGEGIASRYPGNGVARNDCVYPWTNCQTIKITSLETGLTAIVTPMMYCDCYTGTTDERIVDLDNFTLGLLGLNWNDGLYPVRVEPVNGAASSAIGLLPNTAAILETAPAPSLTPFLGEGVFFWAQNAVLVSARSSIPLR